MATHRSTRRGATLVTLVVALAAGLLAACGSDGGTSSDTTSGSVVAATRTVEGAYGPVEIPTDPQRIVGDLMTVDYLTALDYDTSKIVGVFDAGWFQQQPDHYLNEFFSGRELVDPGTAFEMNLEALAAAEPDLIVVPFDQIDGAEQLEELKAVAPLLVVPTSETRDPAIRYGGTASFQDWRSTIRAYGELFELQDAAEAYVTETDQQLADLKAEHAALIGEITATEAKSTPDYMAINVLDAAAEKGVLGTILMSELGFQAPPQQADVEPDEYGTIELSAENTNLVDGDLLILEVREGSTKHEESPLWADLDVVKSDGVFTVGNHWEFGGAVAARQVIADIDAALSTLAAARQS